jgi:ABC-type multidrug transport system fused ATPase/permease subunit
MWRSRGGRLVIASVVLLTYLALENLAEPGRALGLAIGAAVAAIVSGTLGTLSRTASFGGSRQLETRLRRRLLQHLDRVELGWFLGRRAGTVRQAILQDTAWPAGVYSEVYVGIAGGLARAVVTIALLAWLSIPLTVVVLLVGLLRLLPVPANEDLVRAHRTQQNAEEDVNAAVTEFTQGLAVLRAFGGQGTSANRLTHALHERAGATGQVDRLEGAQKRFVDMGRDGMVGIILVLVVGAALIAAGRLEPLALLPFFLLAGAVGDAVSMLVTTRGARRRNQMVLGGIEEVLAQEELEVLEREDPGDTPPGQGPRPAALQLEEVTFGYEHGIPVLEDLSLNIPAGTSVALVGASGTGKTTLARLLPRFWDAYSGRVLVHGHDVRTLEAADLYAQISFVFQDVQLLSRSVRENLLMGRADVTDQQIDQVLEAVRLRERVSLLENGLEAVVGRDVEFSGGEAQRLSVARALLAERPVLVLDEPTAHADAGTDAAVREAVLAATTDRTLVLITHRLTTAAQLDRVVVLDGGRILEDGPPEQLLAQGGEFARLWERAHADGLAVTDDRGREC